MAVTLAKAIQYNIGRHLLGPNEICGGLTWEVTNMYSQFFLQRLKALSICNYLKA